MSDMTRYSHHGLEAVAPAIDFSILLFSAPLATALYQSASGQTANVSTYLGIALLVAGSFVSSLSYRGLYNLESLLSADRQIKNILFYLTIWFSAMLAVAYLMKATSELSRVSTLTFYVVSGLGLVASRFCWAKVLRGALERGVLRRRCVAVLGLGANELASVKKRQLEFRGFDIARQTWITATDEDAIQEGISGLLRELRGSDVEEILISLPHTMLGSLPGVLEQLRSTPLPARMLPDDPLSYVLFQRKRNFGSFGLVDVKREPLSAVERGIKRVLDVGVAGGAIIALGPLLCLVLIALKFDSEGPVLFKQTRRGFNGRTFKILKFRTMHVMEDGPAIVQTTKNDHRVTQVGRWLRRTSIDELPQLWNVLHGDMSIVGPRPHAVAHDEHYDELIENYAFRQHVKPGLTGWAQVNGLRGETPKVEDMKARVDHDLWYINNWSVGFDLRILLITSTKLLSKTAY